MATLVRFMAESLVDLRKPHNIRVMSLSFIQGLMEDRNPGRQPLRSSEEIALKRQWRRVYIWFLAREYRQSCIHLYKDYS